MSKQGTGLRPATDADWLRVFGHAASPPDVWVGLAADGRATVDGLGGMYLTEDGYWWAFFWRAKHVRGRGAAIHRAGRIIADAAREAGIEVRVMRDHRVCTSARWLSRLGFRPTGEIIKDEWEIWQIP